MRAPQLRLAHLHLPDPISYSHSLRLQEAVLARQFTYRDSIRRSSQSDSSLFSSIPQPPPTLLTFSTHPTYTVGRRHLQTNPISAEQQAFLTNKTTAPASSSSKHTANEIQAAEFHPSPRGGLLTYHAPGQLTAYPIIDLRRHGISPRCYVRLLENSVIRTCKTLGVEDVGISSDPGVWILSSLDKASIRTSDSCDSKGPVEGEEEEDNKVEGGEPGNGGKGRKICAVGVQITRGITGHGIGLNVFDAAIPKGQKRFYTFSPTQSQQESVSNGDKPGYLSWGFGRIVACGLEGKTVTWLTREGANSQGLTVEKVADIFARELAKGLSQEGKEVVEGVQKVDEVEVLKGP